ncbi:MAG: hypothetical protein E6K91_06485 [Thaumarchaeota archaeon]|nr:MAG: hypothetical protein E6K91_06485 [Nitrososphaerota archaeon]
MKIVTELIARKDATVIAIMNQEAKEHDFGFLQEVVAMKKLSIIFFGIAVFLGVGLPFYFAPYGFYNGYPELTSFIPISIVLGIGSAVIGVCLAFKLQK